MRTILLVEDEAMLRVQTARGLAKLPGVDVLTAGTMAEAAVLLDDTAPELVICDLDLPDRLGLEILGELGRRGQRAHVVFVSAYLSAFRSQIPRHAGVTVLEKPVELEHLRALVTSTLGLGIGADAAPFTAADYLQLACMGHHSVEIDLARADGRTGRICVVRGEVWSAHDDRGHGEGAFARLAFAKDGLVTCRTLAGPPGQRDLTRSWEAMLMDAARTLDEQSRDQPGASADDVFAEPAEPAEPAPAAVAPTTPTAPVVAAPPTPVDDGYAAAWERGVAALLDHDYRTAWDAFAQALAVRPGDPIASANLTRLRSLGHAGDAAPEENP